MTMSSAWPWLTPPPSLSLSLSHFVITIYGTKHMEQKSLDLTPFEKERGKWTAVQVERACCLWGVALAIRGNISLAVDFNTTGAAASSILAAVQRFSGTQQAARGEARQGGETISLSWQRQPPRPVAPPGHWLLSQKERTEQREGGRERESETHWEIAFDFCNIDDTVRAAKRKTNRSVSQLELNMIVTPLQAKNVFQMLHESYLIKCVSMCVCVWGEAWPGHIYRAHNQLRRRRQTAWLNRRLAALDLCVLLFSIFPQTADTAGGSAERMREEGSEAERGQRGRAGRCGTPFSQFQWTNFIWVD